MVKRRERPIPGKRKTAVRQALRRVPWSRWQGDGCKLLVDRIRRNLTAPATRKKSDRALLATIHEGKPNMPRGKGLLSDRDIQNVLAYIRTPH